MGLLKFFGGPGSVGFLAACCFVGLAFRYVWPRRRPVASLWLLGVFVLYLVLGLPVVASAIAARLPALGPAPSSHASLGVGGTLVVLDGDNRRGRLAEALRIWQEGSPQDVVVSGEAWIVEEMVAAGIPRHRIRQDASTGTTRGQVEWLAGLAGGGEAGPPVTVIASRLQMPRVEALVRARDLEVALVASPVDREPATAGMWRFVPSYAALRISRDALYEVAALEYYEWQGWMEPCDHAGRR